MNKRKISLLVLAGCVSVMMLRYGASALFAARSGGGSNVCSRVSNKFECNAELSTIMEEDSRCIEACPSKEEWEGYCEDTKFTCEDNCEYLIDEGKTEQDVENCKKECSIKEKECKKSYKTKNQCKDSCKKSYDENLKAFEGRWSN